MMGKFLFSALNVGKFLCYISKISFNTFHVG